MPRRDKTKRWNEELVYRALLFSYPFFIISVSFDYLKHKKGAPGMALPPLYNHHKNHLYTLRPCFSLFHQLPQP